MSRSVQKMLRTCFHFPHFPPNSTVMKQKVDTLSSQWVSIELKLSSVLRTVFIPSSLRCWAYPIHSGRHPWSPVALGQCDTCLSFLLWGGEQIIHFFFLSIIICICLDGKPQQSILKAHQLTLKNLKISYKIPDCWPLETPKVS